MCARFVLILIVSNFQTFLLYIVDQKGELIKIRAALLFPIHCTV